MFRTGFLSSSGV